MLELTQDSQNAYTVRVARGVRATIKVDFNNSFIQGMVMVTGPGSENCSLFHDTGATETEMPTKPIPQDAKTCTFSAKGEAYDIKIHRDDGLSFFKCEPSTSETRIQVSFEDQTDGAAAERGHPINDCNNPTVVVERSY